VKEAHLVLVETSANQRLIFATSKPRENVGASHMIWRAGTELTLKAVAPRLFDLDPRKLRAKLRGAHRELDDTV
jgi:hypothetical protein